MTNQKITELENALKNIQQAINELKENELKYPTRHKLVKKQKPKLEDYKRLYFKGNKILEETPSNINIMCENYGKSKTTQRRLVEYSETYNIPFHIKGKKTNGETNWCCEIDYRGEKMPFEKDKIILNK